MKNELKFLTDLEEFTRSGGVNLSDVRQLIHTRIEDLNLGYSAEDAETVECPDCHMPFLSHQLTSHGCCFTCLDKRAAKFTANFLKATENVG